MPGVAAPVALIGIAEKGYMTLSLTASAEGGHSSMPPPHTAIGILAAAIERVEAHPLPASLQRRDAPVLAALAPEMEFPLRVAVANADMLEPVVLRALGGSPRSNATIRTTTAVTMVKGGVKENALPASARAIVNFRILPGDTVQSVTEYVRRVVDDPRVTSTARRLHALDPSPESRERLAAASRCWHVRFAKPTPTPSSRRIWCSAAPTRATSTLLSENVYRSARCA